MKLQIRLIGLAAAATLAACSSGGGDGAGNGGSTDARMTLTLMDGAVDNVEEVHVEISSIWLKSADDDAPPFELPLTESPFSVDLLSLSDENAAILVEDALIPAGSYEWLAMDVNAEFDNVLDSYAVTSAGGEVEIRVPSSRIRLVDGFEVGPNQSVRLLFDWDLRKGLVDPPGLPGYLLKPAFRVLEAGEFGLLTGTVAPETLTNPDNACHADHADLDIGNAVYIFAGSGSDVDDVDETDSDPVATARVALNDMSEYVYRIALMPGQYTIAFTCQAGNDDEADQTGTPEELQFIGVQDIEIAGDPVVIDF